MMEQKNIEKENYYLWSKKGENHNAVHNSNWVEQQQQCMILFKTVQATAAQAQCKCSLQLKTLNLNHHEELSRVHAHIQLHQTKGGRTIPQVFNTKSHKRIFIFSQAEAKRAPSSDVIDIWAPRSGRLDLGA